MSQIRDLHLTAVELAGQAFSARLYGDSERAKELAQQALEYEQRAAIIVATDYSAEPTRSVLYRSAASLAIQCDQYEEAERLLYMGLVGHPPLEIANQLRSLLEQVGFQRHLRLNGFTLDPAEFQLSMMGDAVSEGLAPSDRVAEVLQNIQKIVRRTIDRLNGKSFEDSGAAPKSAQPPSLYVSEPRVGSFAVSLRIGQPEKPMLPTLDYSEVVDEVLDCISLVNADNEAELRSRIQDEAYYRNFVGLVQRLVPDGRDIKMVGLTALREGKEKSVALVRISPQPNKANTEQPRTKGPHLTAITGRLLYADSTHEGRDVIRIVDDSGSSKLITVPAGLMNDLVRPLWGERVTVRVVRVDRKLQLDNVERE